MSAARRLVPLVLLLALSGCASWWSSDKGPKPAPLVEFQPTVKAEIQWRGRVGADGDAVLRPAVVGENVYAAGADGALVRFDKGREVWRSKTEFKLAGGVAADSDLVLVGTTGGEVIAYGAERGERRWRYAAGGEVLGAPLIADDLVVVRVGDSQLVAIDRADGNRRWVYQRSQASLSLRTYSGIGRAGDLLLVGFPGGKLMALTLSGGFPRWEASVATPKGSNELERMADVVGDPVVRGGIACVAAYQGRVACLDVASGVVRWTRDVSSASGVDVDAKHVYVSDEIGNVHAFELSSGATAWKQDKLSNRGVGRPLAMGTEVAVGDAQGWVHLLAADDGRFVGRIQLDSSGLRAPSVPLLGTQWVAQTREGGIYVLNRR